MISMLIYLSVLQSLVYPAALTAFGLVGNAYILGGLIKDLKDDLGGQFKEMKGDIKEIKHDIRGLIRRQTEREIHNMARVQRLVMDCGNNK